MNLENSMMLLRAHAKTGSVKGCKHDSDLNRRDSDVLGSLIAAPFVAFDLFAAGYGHDIIEIGAVRYENDAEIAESSMFVNPGRDVLQEELQGSGITPSSSRTRRDLLM